MRSATLKRISVLMGTVFIDMIGFSMVLTQLPFYAQRFGATPTTIGLLISAYAVAQLTTAPLWGRFSDRYGRRPAILAGLSASAVAFVLFGLAGSLWMLLASRLAQGAGGGTIGVVQAYVSDSSTPGERTQVLGWITAATSAGVMVGPPLGSLTYQLGPAAPGLLAAALCLANIASAWRWLPESVPDSDGTESERTPLRRSLATVVRHPLMPVSRLIWVYALGMLAFMSLNGVLVLYLEQVFDFTEGTIGWFYLYVAGVSLLMRAVLLGPIVRLVGEVRTLQVGALLIGCGLLTIPLADNLLGLALVALFMPVGTSLLFPATTSQISQRFKIGETGQGLGVQQAFGGMARWLGPIWSTLAFERLGITSPFWIAGGAMMAVWIFSMQIRRPPSGGTEVAQTLDELEAAQAEEAS